MDFASKMRKICAIPYMCPMCRTQVFLPNELILLVLEDGHRIWFERRDFISAAGVGRVSSKMEHGKALKYAPK